MTSPLVAQVSVFDDQGGETSAEGEIIITRDGVDPGAVFIGIGPDAAIMFTSESALRTALALS